MKQEDQQKKVLNLPQEGKAEESVKCWRNGEMTAVNMGCCTNAVIILEGAELF
jgi:hypothetical protein